MLLAVHHLQAVSLSQTLETLFSYFMLITMLRFVNCCSPPTGANGDYSIKKTSALERTDEAEIIVVGSVIGLFDDRFRRSVVARIAVHVKLKGGENVTEVVDVSGFNTHRQDYKVFRSESQLDCTGTNVELYGTYLFFIKLSHRKMLAGKLSYHVDEIGMQPAVVKIPCSRRLTTDLHRIIRKYRKSRNNRVECYANKRKRTTRKCLRRKYFMKLINRFSFKNMRLRTIYCSIKNFSPASRSRKTNSIRLKDYVPKKTISNIKRKIRTRRKRDSSTNKLNFERTLRVKISQKTPLTAGGDRTGEWVAILRRLSQARTNIMRRSRRPQMPNHR